MVGARRTPYCLRRQPSSFLVIGAPQEKPIARKSSQENVTRGLIQAAPERVTPLHHDAAVGYV
jgi:hypothetical protein